MSSDLASLAFIVGMAIALPLVAWGLLRFGRHRPVDIVWDSPGEDADVPSAAFRPGAVELLRRVGIEGPYVGDASDETYAVHGACVEISNRLFRELGAEAHRRGDWPADEALLKALRGALDEQPENYAGPHVAYTLVRCGRVTPDIVKGLHPLKRMAFAWRDRGYTGARVEAMLREAGIARELPASAIAAIDGWIRDPISALEHDAVITDLLFDTRRVLASLEHSGYQPRHDELLVELARAAIPPVVLSDARQEVNGERFKDVTATMFVGAKDAPDAVAVLSDQGSHWIVEYAYHGKPHGFLAKCNATWMDLDAVLRHFDALMAGLGHPDRAFRLASENDIRGDFVVAPHEKFRDLARDLAIPLHSSP
jgi:hypothetical protein